MLVFAYVKKQDFPVCTLCHTRNAFPEVSKHNSDSLGNQKIFLVVKKTKTNNKRKEDKSGIIPLPPEHFNILASYREEKNFHLVCSLQSADLLSLIPLVHATRNMPLKQKKTKQQ